MLVMSRVCALLMALFRLGEIANASHTVTVVRLQLVLVFTR